MKKAFLELIKEKPIFFDGAMGTELLEKGLVLGDSAERFSPYFSEIIANIHQGYFNAGADVIHTNTYGATIIGLGKKLEGKIQQINFRQVEIAHDVCPKNGYIAGNVGPNAVLLEKDGGDFTVQMLREALDEQITALVKGKVDLISIETMYYIEEAEEAIKSVKEQSDLPIVASMTFDNVAEGFRTPIENKDTKECIQRMEKAGADVVGCGCTLGSYQMIALAKEIKSIATKPVIVQPTAGAPLSVAGKNLYPINPERFAQDMLEIRKLGVEALGGCCGTTKEYIQKMVEEIKKIKLKI